VKGELPRLMQDVGNLEVPLIVEIGAGENWDKAH